MAAKKKKKVTKAAKTEESGPKILNVGYELVDPSTLVQHPRNPRRGDVDAIAESIGANGFYGSVVARKSTREILRGNHTTRAGSTKGMAKIPVIWVECDDMTAERIVLVDNRTNDLAGYDDADLASLLKDASDAGNLLGTGFTVKDVEKMLKEVVPPSEFVQFDADIETEHKCPKCNFTWSGSSK